MVGGRRRGRYWDSKRFIIFLFITQGIFSSTDPSSDASVNSRFAHPPGQLRGICEHYQSRGYTVQHCCIWYAYNKSRTQVVSCKSNLQLACDCRVRHKECCGLLKQVLKPYNNHSDKQFDIMEIVQDFCMMREARTIKIACHNRKQKSYHVNQPLAYPRATRPGFWHL